jgi:two-component system osmolarity sensor histidine kinase EnvZ
MRLLPKSTFGRMALLIAVLLIINQVVSYVSVVTYLIKPHMKQMVQLMATEVRIVLLDMDHEIPEDLSQTFTETTGIRVFSEPEALRQGLDQAVYYRSISRMMTEELGMDAEVRFQENDQLFAWIRIPKYADAWIRLPLAKFDREYPSPLLIYLTAISLLSIFGGWFLARHISRPLRRLRFAVRELGRGDSPGRLKEEGSQELVELTRAFNQMAQNLHQLEEDRNLLLAGVSHDLRTPLTRIRLSAEFLPDEAADIREGIIRDTEDMDSIIEQFIAFVKEGREEPCIWSDPCELTRQVVELADREGRIRASLDTCPRLHIRPMGFKRMLSNLIENALRYSDGPVDVRTLARDGEFHVEVLDEGPGIEPSQLSRLFQPFTRGDAARSGQSGSGLGLAIVQRLAHMHQGRVELHNRKEGGLRAVLILPLPQSGN